MEKEVSEKKPENSNKAWLLFIHKKMSVQLQSRVSMTGGDRPMTIHQRLFRQSILNFMVGSSLIF